MPSVSLTITGMALGQVHLYSCTVLVVNQALITFLCVGEMINE